MLYFGAIGGVGVDVGAGVSLVVGIAFGLVIDVSVFRAQKSPAIEKNTV